MMSDLTQSPAWKALENHCKVIAYFSIADALKSNPERAEKYSLELNGLYFDYAKNHVQDKTMELLFNLARAQKVESWRDKMFSGAVINNTENRAVLHTALRRPETDQVVIDGKNIIPFVHDVLNKMKAFSNNVRSGLWTGYTGKAIKTIVNIGIGGSDLGPNMVYEALKENDPIKAFFVSNIDGAHLQSALSKCDAETTLFIIASKTFTTQETLTNAGTAKRWLTQNLGSDDAVSKHFVALSTNTDAVKAFGIDVDNMFPFKDWVGGRYSLWSAIGLSICIACGFEKFRALLDGANAMDTHFQSAPLNQNMPVIMALLGLWYRNFLGAESMAILPYAQALHRFPAYLQQLDMESNGKIFDRDGNRTDYDTGPVIFGEPGTNGQHAFYQLIHQGTSLIPCDFIGVKAPSHEFDGHHDKLLANMIAQSQALMVGRDITDAELPYKVFEGNKPSNVLLVDRLDAYHLGMLIALYEHKVFVQGILWNINSFDQWGVELGKVLTGQILNIMEGESNLAKLDASTRRILQKI